MTTASQSSRILPYLRLLLEDESVQEQLGDAVRGLRESARRVQGRRASEAIQDRRLRRQLADVAGSLNEVVGRLNQPPPPKRHLMRRVLVLVTAAGAIGLIWQRRR